MKKKEMEFIDNTYKPLVNDVTQAPKEEESKVIPVLK
jgi:hypothetical protein